MARLRMGELPSEQQKAEQDYLKLREQFRKTVPTPDNLNTRPQPE